MDYFDRITWFVIILAVILFLTVLEMVRRRQLAEGYSLMWLFGALGVLILALSRPVLDNISNFIGVGYPPSVLFASGFGILLLIQLFLSAVIPRLTRQVRTLIQRLGLLLTRVDELEARIQSLEKSAQKQEHSANEHD